MDDKVDVLLGGADDYVVKPFEIREVLARVQVQLRKSSGAKETKCWSTMDFSLTVRSTRST